LINLAKAIGRIVVSYKDMQNLAGYTTLIHEMDEVLDDLRSGTYVRTQVVEKEINNDSEQIERTENIKSKQTH
jgi:ATP-binding cassette subfamily D (ALD) protein 3